MPDDVRPWDRPSDIVITGSGIIRRFTPMTEVGRRWIAENVDTKPEQWHEGSWLVEASSEELIVRVMVDDDLNVKRVPA
jgi:hypothetical protein